MYFSFLQQKCCENYFLLILDHLKKYRGPLSLGSEGLGCRAITKYTFFKASLKGSRKKKVIFPLMARPLREDFFAASLRGAVPKTLILSRNVR